MPKNTPLRSIDNRTRCRDTGNGGGGGSGAGTGITSDAAGAGLTFDGTALNVGAGDGITVAADSVGLASSLAGGGLTYMSGVLAVGAGSGITVNADAIALAASTAGAGLTYTSGVLAVGVSGLGLSVGADAITLTSSSNPGAAASILRTDSSGAIIYSGEVQLFGASTSAKLHLRADTGGYDSYLWQNGATLQIDTESTTAAIGISTDGIVSLANRLRTPTIDTASGPLTLTPTTYVVLSDGKALRTASYTSGFAGAGFIIDQGITETGKASIEADNLTVRGRMRVYELLIHQIRATNGSVFVSSTGRAETVMAISGGYQITTDTDHGFLTGDLIRAQRFTGSGAYVCNLTVTTVFSTTKFDAAYVSGDAAAAGMEFVRLGSNSDSARRGTVYLTADDSGAPFIDVVDGIASHSDWNTAGKVKARFGKLTGITSTANQYGVFMGNSANANVLVDGSGGVQLRQGTTAVITLDTSGASYFAGAMTIGTSGGIYQGTGTFGSPTTGLKIWNDGGIGRIAGYNSGSLQWYAGTNGKLQFGADKGVLDAAGMALYYDSSASPGTESSIIWYNTPSTRTGQIGYISFGDDAGVYAPEVAALDRGHALRIKSTNAIMPSIIVQSTSDSGTVWHSANDGHSSGLDADTVDGYQASALALLAGATFTGAVGVNNVLTITQNGQAFKMIGTNHSYVAWFPDGTGAGRKAYFGFGSSLDDHLSFINEASDGSIKFGTNGIERLTIDSAGAATFSGTLNASGALGGSWQSLTLLTGVANYSGYAQSKCKKFGDLVMVVGSFAPNTSFPSSTFATLPSGYAPGAKIIIAAAAVGKTIPAHMEIDTSGNIKILNKAALGIDPTAVYFVVTYSTGLS